MFFKQIKCPFRTVIPEVRNEEVKMKRKETKKVRNEESKKRRK